MRVMHKPEGIKEHEDGLEMTQPNIRTGKSDGLFGIYRNGKADKNMLMLITTHGSSTIMLDTDEYNTIYNILKGKEILE